MQSENSLEKSIMLGMGDGTRKRGRNKLDAHRTMRFNKRSRRLEEDGHGNHQKSDST